MLTTANLKSIPYLCHSEQSWPSDLEPCDHGLVSDNLLPSVCEGLSHLFFDNFIIMSLLDLRYQCQSFQFKAALGLTSRIGRTKIYFCFPRFFDIISRLTSICRFVLEGIDAQFNSISQFEGYALNLMIS